MDFYTVVGQVVELLQRQGRASYRALKRQFGVDDDFIEDLKEELLYIHESAVQSDDRGFTWTGDTEDIQRTTASQPDPAEPPPPAQEKSPIQVESPPSELHTRDAERRQLTVMFCDLVGSTDLSGTLDPEDLREVVRAYQESAAEVIQRYEGHIAQYLGDGLLVYFGWPQAHEDDAQRAVHTGLGIVEAVDDLNTTLETAYSVRLAVRLGIHTGPVVVGEIGGGDRHETLALGETPNIAARLEALAVPNTVVLSNATRRLVSGAFDCDDLGRQDLKGVKESFRSSAFAV